MQKNLSNLFYFWLILLKRLNNRLQCGLNILQCLQCRSGNLLYSRKSRTQP